MIVILIGEKRGLFLEKRTNILLNFQTEAAE